MIPGDYNNDGTLDVLTIWRWGTTLGVQTYFAATRETQTAGALKETEIGLSVGHGGPEFVRIVRRKGAADGSAQAIHFVAHDPNSQDLYLVVGTLTDGVMTQTSTFNTTAPGIAKTEAIVGIEAVDVPGVMDGDAPEILVLVRGTTGAGAKQVFATMTTNTRDSKLSQFSTMDFLGGMTPDQHRAGTHYAGLVRGPAGIADHRFIYDSAKLYAWTVGPTGEAGAFQMRRVSINSSDAGTVLATTAIPDVLADETGFELQAIEHDGNAGNDIILSSYDAVKGDPKIRTWTVDLEGTIGGYRTKHLGGGLLGNCSFGPDKPFTTTILGDRNGSPPFYKPLTTIPNEVTFATTLKTTFDPANPIGIEVVWGSSTDTHLSARPLVLGGSAALASFDPKTQRLTTSRRGDTLNLSAQSTDDRALVASHKDGLQVYFDYTGKMLVSGSRTNGGTFELPPNAGIPWIKSTDAGDDEDFPTSWAIIVGSDDGAARNFYVWSVDSAGIKGPGILKVSEELGVFQPTTSAGADAIFADATDGTFKAFSVTTQNLLTLAETKETLTITGNSVKTLVGEPTAFPAHLREKIIPGTVSILPERRFKTTYLEQKDVGFGVVDHGQETVTVVGYDSPGLCDLKTVIYPGELGALDPVTLSEGTMEDCWDLHVPEVFADICGVGGVQFVTGAATDTTARSQWIWTYYLWTRQGTDIVATEIGTVTAPPQERPRVTSSDINGDGTMDLLVRVDNAVMAPGEWHDTVLFSDGLGGGLTPTNAIPNFTDAIRQVPGAGANQGGGQSSCGQDLQCNLGTGTRTTCTQANNKAELL